MNEEQRTLGLFEQLARRRPEWLAQGVLMHALNTQPSVERMFRHVLGVSEGCGSTLKVTEEVPGDDGWRADLELRWGGTTGRVELKLLAPLTPRQRNATMDAIVVPSSRRDEGLEQHVVQNDKGRVITWKQIADELGSAAPTLRALLDEIDGYTRRWVLREVASDVVADELSQVGGKDGKWPHIYRWLSTLDIVLTEQVPGYRSQDSWSISAKPYYGYFFGVDGGPGPLSTTSFWIGFTSRRGRPTFECWRTSDVDSEVRLPGPFVVQNAIDAVVGCAKWTAFGSAAGLIRESV